MDIEHATAFLYSLNPKGIRFGLENTRLVLEQLGRPQDRFRAVHLAGSNGKGSTAAFLEALLRPTGLRVGLYTSPHLNHFRERFRVDGQPVADEAIAALTDRLLRDGLGVDPAEVIAWIDSQDMILRMRSDSWYGERGLGHEFCRLTFFECTTVLGLLLFEQAGVELAVMETGMGGRLDATNVLLPEVSVITPIQLEHTQWLGDTLAAIAGEKAGIIKPGVPVVVARQQPEAREVIARVAHEQGSPVHWLGEQLQAWGDWQQAHFTVAGRSLGPVRLGLVGSHQVDNAALALGCLPLLGPPAWPADAERIEAGLRAVDWAGRFERLALGSEWVLDGAHNPDGVRVLAGALREVFPGRRLRLVFGVLGDKDAGPMLAELCPLASQVHLVRPTDARGRDPRELQVPAGIRPIHHPSLGLALESLLPWPGEPVLVCGSLTVVGEARAWLLSRGARPIGYPEVAP